MLPLIPKPELLSGGFNAEVRKLVVEKDLIGSFGVEAFSGTAIEF